MAPKSEPTEEMVIGREDVGQLAVTRTEPAGAVSERVATDILLGDAAKRDSLVPFKTDDLAIPFLRVLQKGSPQVNKRDPGYIEGAEAGMFYNTVTGRFFDGEKQGILLVPLSFTRSVIEWNLRENGGGFVKDWGTDESPMKNTHKDEKNRNVTPDGTQIVSGVLYYVFHIEDVEQGLYSPVAFPLQSTQMKKSRRWNTLIDQLRVRHPQEGRPPFKPAPFYQSYIFKTVFESNTEGDWMGITVNYHKPVIDLPYGSGIYLEARNWASKVERGEVRARTDLMAEAEVSEVNTAADKAFG